MPEVRLAFDKSARRIDPDGRLFVEASNISKATVNPYLGSEIPDGDSLGLDPARVYMLLRDPAELAAAASTFANLPLLIKHVPVSAAEPRQDLVVGSTGSDVAFEAPYLRCSLSVWDAKAIAGIESKEQTELSSAYRYRADMTPGTFEGLAYDGVMRDLCGNHVALVDIGRAGSDVVVSDQNPFVQRGQIMPTSKRKPIPSDLVQGLIATTVASLKPLLATDASPEALRNHLLKLAADTELAAMDPALDEAPDDDDEMEDDPDKPGAKRKKVKAAMDTDPPADPEGGAKKPAMDAAAVAKAIKLATDAAVPLAVAQAVAATNALHEARALVAPLVGAVALDSAEAVYKFALDHAKVPTNGVHPSAYRALVEMLARPAATKADTIAMDEAGAADLVKRFPHAARFLTH